MCAGQRDWKKKWCVSIENIMAVRDGETRKETGKKQKVGYVGDEIIEINMHNTCTSQ